MTSTRRLASALCLALCFSGYSNAQDTTTQIHDISDDGFVNVPLQFGFPFYGQTFNNSWMFSNGVISFQDPQQSGLDWANLSVQNFSSTMGNQFNYSIFPLWTDLINIVGSFTSEGGPEFQRYNWIGISPFYDSSRLNTFSVEIRPDGQIIANYSLINVDYGIVGTVGNASLGEYEQLYSSPGSITDWSRYTHGDSPQEPEQGPGSSFQVTTVTPIMEITQSDTGVDVRLMPQSVDITASIESTSERLGGGILPSPVLRILAREQSRIKTTERSVVESMVEQSIGLGQQVQEQAQTDADISDGLSIPVYANQNLAAMDQQQSMMSKSLDFDVLSTESAMITSTSQIQDQIDNPVSDNAQNTPPNPSHATQGVAVPRMSQEAATESTPQYTAVAGFIAVDVIPTNSDPMQESQPRQARTDTVRSDVPNNELSGGISLASLGVAPAGFQAYSVALPDATFYAPREIYRDQRTTDNPAGRRLFGGSDQLHQLMIDQQYAR